MISTHTLTWSVTKTRWLNVSNSFHFNSHAHVERDLLCFTVSLVYVISTHTLTWSVTQKNICRTPIKSFQLTRSRGAWQRDIVKWAVKGGISTHTLTWSVTFGVAVRSLWLFISTHTLTWSVTITSEIRLPYLSFQLTRSRGAWLFSNSGWVLVWNFNSHAHVERDKIVGRRLWPTGISTHTLTWSVT